ncbi:hypothetical protein HanRHA438_Chr14g0640431 [Helianthus annuus]|uniref:DUF4228 domain protein n=1 Tax=Helianthus annuus TaxID=4232 RepID=A0A251SFB5_HELAN|nr:uncharacterized protein LOC110906658 [Helianthus annuus]KAF5767849.1 hypothetical protein HanXRQr2_Chr14g0629521 [Helianthus annuus]KAJ0467218.1 hypothetical protein HanIR_Chr14g0682901 [Helianthus annuus]KAJ0484673.1 hypothetical protein HanHA89_Chr14g0559491 [Helianthus annuus]KAJ0638616.1 hypothetical protein HanHA300_Chr00c0081g0706031 [Helianthus annuus]KAJ0655225.1 hypothetical protein HanLR1_Chr14g0521781 [Helianthus annuus]
MGNLIGTCCMASKESFVKVIYWEGNTKTLTGRRRLAGEIMFEFPESMVCDADRFFIGHAIPALAIDDQLIPGKTYLVLPLDIFSTEILSVSSISAFVALNHRRTAADLKDGPLEYINGSNGSILMKVKPEFMARHLSCRGGHGNDQENDVTSIHAPTSLCSTPELQKEYKQLVRSKDQTWSPNLDTISEANKIRYSPYRIIGLE